MRLPIQLKKLAVQVYNIISIITYLLSLLSLVENLKKITSNRILFCDSYSGLPSDAAFASQEAEFIKKHPDRCTRHVYY